VFIVEVADRCGNSISVVHARCTSAFTCYAANSVNDNCRQDPKYNDDDQNFHQSKTGVMPFPSGKKPTFYQSIKH
jgi:hypothetical protein